MLRRSLLKQIVGLPFMPRLKLDLNGGVMISDNITPLAVCEWARHLAVLRDSHGVTISQILDALKNRMTHEEVFSRYMLTFLPRWCQDEIDEGLMSLDKAFVLETDYTPEEIWESAKLVHVYELKAIVSKRRKAAEASWCND